MPENVTTEPDGASTNVLAELTDFDLDQKIGKKIQMIGNALAGRDDALKAVTKCEKSAVISAWRLGQFLIEKKRRLGHGQWLPWLSTVGLGERQARRYLRLAEIGLESDLGRFDHRDNRSARSPRRGAPESGARGHGTRSLVVAHMARWLPARYAGVARDLAVGAGWSGLGKALAEFP